MRVAKRPKPVWVILIFFALSSVWATISSWLVYSRTIPVPEETYRLLFSPGWPERALGIIGFIVAVAFLVALFLMRRVALTLFSVHLAITAISYLWAVFFTAYLSVLRPATLVGVVIGWVLLIAIWRYLRRLAQRGLLT
jgi:multisubunit Na+/H+ antiporter MnhF subunit